MGLKRGQRPLETEDSWSVDTAPGRVLFGAGVIDLVGDLVQELGGGRVLVVTDPGVAAAGHLDRASASLRSAGLEVAVFSEVRENPGERDVAEAAAAARSHRATFLVGLGGGSAMDCAKGANFVFTNGGRMEDYWGFGKASRPMLPSIGVPCTAGTGSEAQSFAVISREDDHRKMACGDPKARFLATLLDPELARTAPPYVMAATGLDAFSHAMESFVATAANPYSRMFASEGFRRLLRGFEVVVEAQSADSQAHSNARSEVEINELWGDMLLGAHLAGAAIEASMLGAAHGLANPLTARYDITHGVAVAVMLDHVVRYNGETGDTGYTGLVRLLGGSGAGNPPASTRLAESWTGLRRSAGVAGRLRDLGVREADLEVLATQASKQWTAQFNPRAVTASDMLSLYQAAF
ncbi:MAG: iron-containing alcohol dehydrogenase [Acidobacteria bacterium]|nr:iron-containing alcohol dehydrogenase [Acidobacteriota bacterium]MCY3964299.1 iron-containing alcohol dehydrogenase [Acidobacteriota bacterium]